MSNFRLTIKLSFIPKAESIILSLVVGLIAFFFLMVGFFFILFKGKFYPGIVIDGKNLQGLSIEQALSQLNSQENQVPQHTIYIVVDDIKVSSSSALLSPSRKYEPALRQAFEIGRTGNLLDRIIILGNLKRKPQYFYSSIEYDQASLQMMIDELKSKIDILGNFPQAQLLYSGNADSIVIDPGSDGRELETSKTLEQIYIEVDNQKVGERITQIPNFEFEVNAHVASTSAKLDQEQQSLAAQRAAKLVGTKITINEDQGLSNDHVLANSELAKAPTINITLTDQDLISILDFPSGYSKNKLEILLTGWEERISRPPQEAVFDYNKETLKVLEFIPDKPGLTIDIEKTQRQILDTLIEWEKQTDISDPPQTELPMHLASQPALTTLADTNNLGINEQIGFGESYYSHSIASRVHNVALTTKKINFTLVGPGKSFSFNQTLGEVSQQTGFKPAYVIKSGRTELGDGGGVCQVSTTLFRALLDAGLEITRRRAHSYRVGYYEENSEPGFDATVYSGDVDLRFTNDTDHYILIVATADTPNRHLVFEIFGTSDGRTTEITGYKQWGYQPPLPPEYIPDPSLPTGAKTQIDWSQSGLKTTFTHIVRDKDGNEISKNEYYSNYRPWAAKFLVGV